MRRAPGSSHDIMFPKLALKSRRSPVGPHCSPRPGAAAADDGARLAPGQAAEAVVPEDQVEEAVVLRPADVGPVRRRGELHRGHPPTRGHHGGDAQHRHLPDPAPPAGRRGKQIDDGQGRDDQEGLQHFGDETEADQRPGQDQPLRLCLLQARTRAYMEPARRSASRLSGLLKRNIMAATGVRATTAPARSAAWALNQRRTVR
jgi:hypothetical protein